MGITEIHYVIPADSAGISRFKRYFYEIPAFAGMTRDYHP